MARNQVLHRQIYKPGFAEGMVINTTLYGRVDNSQNDYNVAGSDKEVSCTFCRSILDGKTVHRNKKWLDWQPED